MMSPNRQNLRVSTLGLSAILISLTVLQQCHLSTAATLYKSQGASSNFGQSCQNVCTSPACTRNAEFFRSIMKPTLDPCDDFYQFVCGNFINRYDKVISKRLGVNYGVMDMIQAAMDDILRATLRDVKPDDISAVKKMKIYYQNCLNENRMEAEGMGQALANPILNILENIGGWPLLLGEKWNEINFNWKDAVYKIHNEKYPVFFPTMITVIGDIKNSTKSMLEISPAKTRIKKSYLSSVLSEKLKTHYFNFIVNVAAALGADRDKIHEQVKDILNFEINLCRIEKDDSQKQAMEQIIMPVKELSGKYSYIPWLELFNRVFNSSGIAIDDTEFVIIDDPEYITKLEKLIEVTPKRVLANYLAWHVVGYSLVFMSSEIRKLLTNFLIDAGGNPQSLDIPDIPRRCLSEVVKALPVAVEAMYVRKFFDQSIKDDVSEIVNNIKKQIKRNFEKISWIDDQTRKYAIEKLEAINAIIGHADELMEDDKVNEYYKNLDIIPGSYFLSQLNFFNFKYFKKNKFFSSNTIDWTKYGSAISVSPYYMTSKNSIGIPAGSLQVRIFDRHRPQYLNYGAIGSMIGHEITHAFDSYRRKIDKSGNEKKWESNTEEQYLKKARCIIDQYSNFTVDQIQLHVNGNNTQNENIADNGGYRAAYLAYKEWAKSQRVSEGCLPNLNYTPQQMFWISAASSVCSKSSSEHLTNVIMNCEHSPDVSRVIVSFSNIKEFAEDFQCKPNSRMNPKEKCVLW